ncbi:Pol polyprotein [Fasciola hepatica]|uniref:Pol polyprotein n=1 Tax=Fasciola hepatica TaxID=6192 RepID=A0A2H1CVJ1_FASHE|nr:Pol polyprotein [Fasciola hepatica]
MAQDTKPEMPKLESVEKHLPVFWSENPSVWFVMAESYFHIWNVVKSDTKFAYVVASLPEKIAVEVSDLILHPHPAEPYEQFKSAVLKRLSDTDKKCFERLLFSEELGNCKPSELLRHLKRFDNGRNLGQSVFRELFLQRLPPHVRSILSSRKTLTLEELATLADDLMELTHTSQVTTMSSNPTEETSRALCKQIETLNNNFQQLRLLLPLTNPSPYCPSPKRFSTPDTKFDHVYVGVLGPLPSCDGFTHIFTCIDHTTQWPEAVPIKDGAAATVARAFVECWISRFGVPRVVSAIKQSQFQSQPFRDLFGLLKINRSRPSVLDSCATDVVGDFHRQLKNALRPHGDAANWAERLSMVLLGIRTDLKSCVIYAPAEVVYGMELNLPDDLVQPDSFFATTDESDYAGRLTTYMHDFIIGEHW